MSFVPQTVLDSLAQLTRTQADAQRFGVVQVTDEGVVKLYNRWESELAGVAVAAGRLVAARGAAAAYQSLTGKLPPGLNESSP